MAQPHHHRNQRHHFSMRHHISSICSCTLTCLAAVCCLPCICVIGGSVGIKHLYRKAVAYERPKTRERKFRERRRKERERRMPRKLTERDEWSVLTLPLTEPEPELERATEFDVFREKMSGLRDGGDVGNAAVKRVKKKTDGQVTSGFFNLPLEIRRQIYEEVLAGYVFHIYFRDCYRTVSATRCKNREPEICKNEECRKKTKVQGARDEWGNVGLLPLLMSCRRVYSEAIEILYKRNTFEFDKLQTILQFSMTIMPKRLRLIQSVQWKKTYVSSTYYYEPPWNDCTGQLGCGCAVCLARLFDIDYALVMHGAI